jgi:hypothetical protein
MIDGCTTLTPRVVLQQRPRYHRHMLTYMCQATTHTHTHIHVHTHICTLPANMHAHPPLESAAAPLLAGAVGKEEGLADVLEAAAGATALAPYLLPGTSGTALPAAEYPPPGDDRKPKCVCVMKCGICCRAHLALHRQPLSTHRLAKAGKKSV